MRNFKEIFMLGPCPSIVMRARFMRLAEEHNKRAKLKYALADQMTIEEHYDADANTLIEARRSNAFVEFNASVAIHEVLAKPVTWGQTFRALFGLHFD
jgi:hypothetical protein